MLIQYNTGTKNIKIEILVTIVLNVKTFNSDDC